MAGSQKVETGDRQMSQKSCEDSSRSSVEIRVLQELYSESVNRSNRGPVRGQLSFKKAPAITRLAVVSRVYRESSLRASSSLFRYRGGAGHDEARHVVSQEMSHNLPRSLSVLSSIQI